MWKGVILEESLINKEILKKVKIVNSEQTFLEKTGELATFHDVIIDDDKIDEVCQLGAGSLKPKKFYMHFWQNGKMIVVFPNKRFDLSKNDQKNIDVARNYGKTLNIPLEQMEFEKLFDR